jgi:hypothetical protein
MKTGTLLAVPFDVKSLQATGAPVTLTEGVMQGLNAPNGEDNTGAGQFTVSTSGTLLYLLGGLSPILESSWVWVERTGAAQQVTAVPAGPFLFPRLSPDGLKVAVNVRSEASRTSDVWVYDLGRGAPTRLTFDGRNSWPVWSPDGKRLVYAASTTGATNLYAINADGSGSPNASRPATGSRFHLRGHPPTRSRFCSGLDSVWVGSGLLKWMARLPQRGSRSCSWNRVSSSGIRSSHLTGSGWRTSPPSPEPLTCTYSRTPVLARRSGFRQPEERNRSGARTAGNSCTDGVTRCSPQRSALCLRSGPKRLAWCSSPSRVSTMPRRLFEAGTWAPTAGSSFYRDTLNQRTSRSPRCTSC